MEIIKAAGIVLVLLVTTFTAKADGKSDANRLVVEAAQLIRQANSASVAAKRLKLLQRAERNLKPIIAKYPGSNAAHKLVTGQGIGNMSLKTVAASIEVAEQEARAADCLDAPTPVCLVFEAMATANTIKSHIEAMDVIADIAVLIARIGEIPSALSIARGLKKFPGFQTRVFAAVARAQIKAGDTKTAFKTINEARNIVLRKDGPSSLGLIELAFVVIEAGDLPGARRDIHAVLNNAQSKKKIFARAFRLVDVTKLLIDLRQLPEAKALLKQASDSSDDQYSARTTNLRWSLSRAQGKIAEAEITAGNFSGAKATAAKISYQPMRGEMFDRIAKAQLKAGDISAAMETAKSNPYKSYQANILGEIASVRAKGGKIRDALAMARAIQGLSGRVRALRKIAVIQFNNNKSGEARQLLREAFEIARRDENLNTRIGLLWQIIQGYYEINDLPEARRVIPIMHDTIGKIADLANRVSNLLSFASEQAERKDVAGARDSLRIAQEYVQKIKDPGDRTSQVLNIATEKAKLGDVKDAGFLIKTVPDATKRALAFAELGLIVAKK